MPDEEKRPGDQAGALPKANQSYTKPKNPTALGEGNPPRPRTAYNTDERPIEVILEEMYEAYLEFWAERRDIPGDGEEET